MRTILFCCLLKIVMLAEAQRTNPMDHLRPFQENIIKVLAGMIPYEGSNYLDDRSTADGRETTSAILRQYLMDAGLKPQFHNYRAAHPMIFPDLFFAPAKGTNVYAILETNPVYDYVVIGAHYDAEPGSPGAGDNASGVALVTSLAKVLSVRDSLPANYIFVFFDQEEDDEIGSKSFADFIQEEGYAIHSVHVTDLAGWDKDGDRVIIVQSSDELMKDMYTKASQKLGIDIRLTQGGSSDNKSFQSEFPTAGVFGDITKHLHKPTDTYQTVDFEYLNLMTWLMSEVLVALDNKAL